MENINRKDNEGTSLIEEFISQENLNIKLTQEDKEYIKYSEKFQKRFGRSPYIAEPSETKTQTIEAIKKCLKENKDILDELLYPDSNKFIY